MLNIKHKFVLLIYICFYIHKILKYFFLLIHKEFLKHFALSTYKWYREPFCSMINKWRFTLYLKEVHPSTQKLFITVSATMKSFYITLLLMINVCYIFLLFKNLSSIIAYITMLFLIRASLFKIILIKTIKHMPILLKLIILILFSQHMYTFSWSLISIGNNNWLALRVIKSVHSFDICQHPQAPEQDDKEDKNRY